MTTETDSGEAGAFWQYPVKSKMGEELNVVEVMERGLHCDRGAIVA